MRTRTKRAVALALIVGLASLIPLGQAIAGGPTTLNAVLTGAAEVPGPGDTNGTGNAQIVLDPLTDEVCFDLDWDGIGRPVAAHIHRGGPTKAGPVRVELFASSRPLPRTISAVQGCVRNVDTDLVDAIILTPAKFYVNVHTRVYPDGAIRGQLA